MRGGRSRYGRRSVQMWPADGADVDLGNDVIVEIKPYASFHTMWEI